MTIFLGRFRLIYRLVKENEIEQTLPDALFRLQTFLLVEQLRCANNSSDGIEIPTPCQSGIHKAIYKRAAQLKEHLVSTLYLEKWSLHFDDKRIEGFEYQAVVLKNDKKELKLAALKLNDGKTGTIAEALRDVLDEFRLWKSILRNDRR